MIKKIQLVGGPYCGVIYDAVKRKVSTVGAVKGFKVDGYSFSIDEKTEVLGISGPYGSASYFRYLNDLWRYRKASHVP